MVIAAVSEVMTISKSIRPRVKIGAEILSPLVAIPMVMLTVTELQLAQVNQQVLSLLVRSHRVANQLRSDQLTLMAT
jgi:hypothetical protein